MDQKGKHCFHLLLAAYGPVAIARSWAEMYRESAEVASGFDLPAAVILQLIHLSGLLDIVADGAGSKEGGPQAEWDDR